MSLIRTSKSEFRAYFRSLVVQELGIGFESRQLQLNTVLREFMRTQSGIWGAYRSLKTEASVDAICEDPSVEWVFPKVNRDQLDFYKPHGFAQGPFGIMEPSDQSVKVEISRINGLLIPGLGFNKEGRRLGKGKGYYDRALAEFKGVKVGVCFNFQITTETIPCDEFDIPMDYLISEAGVVNCKVYRES